MLPNGHASMASHEAFDPVHGLDDLLVGRGVADPDVAGARGPERAPGHDPDALLGQQQLGERRLVQPGRIGDAWEAVEGALRLEGREPDLVEAIGDVAAASVVLGAHRLKMRLSAAKRLDRGKLGGRGGAHDPVLVDLRDAGHQLRRGGDPSDPPTGHRVALAEAAEQDRALAHRRQRAEGGVLVVAVHEPVVDLVAVHEQVVLLGDPRDRLELRPIEHGAGRVVRVAEEDRLRAWRDRRRGSSRR